MRFGSYLFNMTDEDFKEARELAVQSKTLSDDHELKLRIQALKESLSV